MLLPVINKPTRIHKYFLLCVLISSYSADLLSDQLRVFFYLIGAQRTCCEMVHKYVYQTLLSHCYLMTFGLTRTVSWPFRFSKISSSHYFCYSFSPMEVFVLWRWLKNLRWSSGYNLCIFLVIIDFNSAVLYYNLAFAHLYYELYSTPINDKSNKTMCLAYNKKEIMIK